MHRKPRSGGEIIGITIQHLVSTGIGSIEAVKHYDAFLPRPVCGQNLSLMRDIFVVKISISWPQGLFYR
jgi:hypothetical protein